MTDRMLQINEKIHHLLAELFSQGIEIPVEFFISVTKISCAPDLRSAKVFVSILPFDKSEEGLQWLIDNRKQIQGLFGKKANLKYTPMLKFVIDESEEGADEIFSLMDQI